MPAVTALNKVDLLDQPRTVKALQTAAALGVDGEIFPISARTGAGVAPLVEAVGRHAAGGAVPVPAGGRRATSAEEVRIAELVREQVLLRTREELPHAVEVEIDEIEEREDGLLMVRARVWAETESQKGILVGAGGRMVKAVGTAAAHEIESADGPPRAPRPARAGAPRLAAGRGVAGPARNRMSLDRILAHLRRTEEAIVDEVRPLGEVTALLTPSLPLVWQLNAVRVEDGDAAAERLVAAADRALGHATHRKLVVHDERVGKRLAGELGRGWNENRLLVMVRDGDSSRTVPPGLGGEVDRATGAGTLAAFRREQPFGWQEEAVRQLGSMDDRYSRALDAHDFVAPLDAPVSACRLYVSEGLAQIDEVGTIERSRGRGFASAAVMAAVAAATTAGCDADLPARGRGRLAPAPVRAARLHRDRAGLRVPEAAAGRPPSIISRPWSSRSTRGWSRASSRTRAPARC